MKIRIATILIGLMVFFTPTLLLAGPADACNPSPCLNGGSCSVVDLSYSCSCPVGFFGPSCAVLAAPNEASVVSYTGDGRGGSNGIGFEGNAPGRSGVGQSFTAVRGGRLFHLSFEIFAQQEAIDEDEPLIFEFWNGDEQGLPDGSPLLTMSLPVSDFIASQYVIKTLNLYDDDVTLLSGEKYAFTLSVDNKATTQFRGMYGIRTNFESSIEYPLGTLIQNQGGLPFSVRSNDLSRFEVTVDLPPLTIDGFESE